MAWHGANETIKEYGIGAVTDPGVERATFMNPIKRFETFKIGIDVETSKAKQDFVSPDI